MKRAVVSCALLLSMGACGSSSGSSSDSMRGARSSNVRSSDTVGENDQGGIDVFDAAMPARIRSTSERADAGKAQRRADASPGISTQRPRDAGMASSKRSEGKSLDGGKRAEDASTSRRDAGKRPEDASSEPDAARSEDASTATADAGRPQNSGSCCSVSDRPGCGDSALRDCVCARQPSCCSEAWGESCTRVIAEKFCQSGVRDCVCGTAEGQWKQTQCCESSWDDTCESVATNKCGASSDCK